MDGFEGKIASDIAGYPALMPLPCEREPVIVVVEDDGCLSETIQDICDFLEVTVRAVASEENLGPLLTKWRPMAVLAKVEAQGQDGCHVMKSVAEHDRNLPILLLTGGDPILAGAADAVEEVWGLSSVLKRPTLPKLGELVEFLCLAGQMGRCLGLMPI
jgi:DNA-binding NtrC family response regulator